MYICMYMFSQVVWSYLYLRLHAALLFSVMAVPLRSPGRWPGSVQSPQR